MYAFSFSFFLSIPFRSIHGWLECQLTVFCYLSVEIKGIAILESCYNPSDANCVVTTLAVGKHLSHPPTSSIHRPPIPHHTPALCCGQMKGLLKELEVSANNLDHEQLSQLLTVRDEM